MSFLWDELFKRVWVRFLVKQFLIRLYLSCSQILSYQISFIFLKNKIKIKLDQISMDNGFKLYGPSSLL
jgi:hypothetical protein